MSRFSNLALGFAAGTLLASAGAEAHPRLTASNPAAGAVARNVRSVRMQFSEALVPAFSGGELIMTGMPGMAARRPMPVAVRSVVANGGRTLVLTGTAPLRPGLYRVNWHVVSRDTHRMAGGFSFAVR
jgi:methionine-rich copper-binding protein CopC